MGFRYRPGLVKRAAVVTPFGRHDERQPCDKAFEDNAKLSVA